MIVLGIPIQGGVHLAMLSGQGTARCPRSALDGGGESRDSNVHLNREGAQVGKEFSASFVPPRLKLTF